MASPRPGRCRPSCARCALNLERATNLGIPPKRPHRRHTPQSADPPDPSMPDQEQLDDFLEALETAGSPAKNPALREALGWEEPLYEEVKAALVAKGIVTRGRGRSDSVSLAGAEPVMQPAAPARATRKAKAAGNGTANLGFEAKLWLTADKLRNNMDAAEYKHVVLGLIFLKYISDSFEEHRAKLLAGEGDYEGADPEDPDEYRAENVFWVPPRPAGGTCRPTPSSPPSASWSTTPWWRSSGTTRASRACCRRTTPDPPRQAAARGTDRPDRHDRTIAPGAAKASRPIARRIILGRVYEYFLIRFASAEGKKGGQFYTPRCVVRVPGRDAGSPTRAASTTPAAAPAACSCRARSSSKATAAGLATSAIYGQESNADHPPPGDDEPGHSRHRGRLRPRARRQLPPRPAQGSEGRLRAGQSAVQRLRLEPQRRRRALEVRRAAQGQRQLRLGAALHPPPGAAGHRRLRARQWQHELQPVAAKARSAAP